MFPEKLGDYGAFLTKKQSFLWQTAVDNAEIIVLAAAGKQYRVFSQSVSCGLIPSAAGEGLIYTVIVQLRPEEPFELFERFQPAKVFKELQDTLFSF
jgi:hypothetical protein